MMKLIFVTVALLISSIATCQAQVAYRYEQAIEMYHAGKYNDAFNLLINDALEGDFSAQTFIGSFYENGFGVPQNYAEAYKFYLAAAQQGDEIAKRSIGMFHFYGRGRPVDYAEARRWFEMAAERNDSDAIALLGTIYLRGLGVQRSAAKARSYYERAALLGNHFAQNNLGRMYLDGGGISQDFELAKYWLSESERHGNMQAVANLAEMHEFGRGTSVDMDLARELHTRIVASNDAELAEQSEQWLTDHPKLKNDDLVTCPGNNSTLKALCSNPGILDNYTSIWKIIDDAPGESEQVERLRDDFRQWFDTLEQKCSFDSLASTSNCLYAAANGEMVTVFRRRIDNLYDWNDVNECDGCEQPNLYFARDDISDCGVPRTPPFATGQKRVALVIGNSSYENVPALQNPSCDAKAITALLKQANFDVQMLLDASTAETLAAVEDFNVRSEFSDVSLFFYAGHGAQIDGVNYMVAVDARTDSTLENSLVRVDDATKQMSGYAKIGVVILDACRDNPFLPSVSPGSRVDVGLAPIESDSGGLVIAFATSPGQVALDGQFEHSPFTQALLEELPQPGVEFEQIMKQVRARVVEATSETDTKQRPWTHSSLMTEFYVFP